MKKNKTKKEEEIIFTITAKKKGSKIHFNIKSDKGLTAEQQQIYIYEIICGLVDFYKTVQEDKESSKNWLQENFPKEFREMVEKKSRTYIS